MLFSGVTFLYYFLPAALALCLAAPRRWKNAALLACSVVFYAWGAPAYLPLLAAETLVAFGAGLLIGRHRGTGKAKLFAALAIGLLVGALALFKYADFFIKAVNSLLAPGADSGPVPLISLALPLGISFYTFQLLSYLFDVYRGKTRAQGNLVTFAAYAFLYAQILSGPIVRYDSIAGDLARRKQTLPDFAAGAQRFVLGLAKKALLANAFADLCAAYTGGTERSALFAWLYIAGYTLRIYYDFSGYSDMAIGLGRMMGFRFPENFDYPYAARSVTEFWRRWHMTLGAWFRDYVYIPLGGNRVSPAKRIRNILAVWALTGLWHGASWNFVLWGLYFALVMTLEKAFLLRALKKLPGLVSHLYTLLVLVFSWCLFDSPTLAGALSRAGELVGAGGIAAAGAWSRYYLSSYAFLFTIGILGATPLPKRLMESLENALARHHSKAGAVALSLARPAALAALLIISSAYAVDGSFNPFIYFRF
ncbi:MAG: Peptidoglycan O-acetyltransferase [Firmicutes bacterium ADurb.Bin248]|nr:MAG: Peptidoglycan O-acetyltransferase [Firmicutes bacterium ADurb.Bin248]HOG01291.1 MBOAT family O-acyltransferase [Clostridia bacterium]HPK16672.1 MBOAT family O-acyltransferase [Clostridia bacterium]